MRVEAKPIHGETIIIKGDNMKVKFGELFHTVKYEKDGVKCVRRLIHANFTYIETITSKTFIK